MTYHHTISGLASIQSVQQYQYNDHVEAWLRSQIKVVGPIYYPVGGIGSEVMGYQATIGDYDLDITTGYGHSVADAIDDLMTNLGF